MTIKILLLLVEILFILYHICISNNFQVNWLFRFDASVDCKNSTALDYVWLTRCCLQLLHVFTVHEQVFHMSYLTKYILSLPVHEYTSSLWYSVKFETCSYFSYCSWQSSMIEFIAIITDTIANGSHVILVGCARLYNAGRLCTWTNQVHVHMC